MNQEKTPLGSINSNQGAAEETLPSINSKLACWTLALAYVLFTAVMTLQMHLNLWLLSIIAIGSLLPLAQTSYRGNLGNYLKVTQKRVIHGLVGGLALAFFSYVLFPPLAKLWPMIHPQIRQLYHQLDVWPGRFWALPLIFLLVLTEEIIWRGLLFDLLKNRLSGWWPVIACTLLFPVPHILTGNFVLGLAAFFLGAVTTLQRNRWDNLLVPLLTHFIWNLAIMVFFPLVSLN